MFTLFLAVQALKYEQSFVEQHKHNMHALCLQQKVAELMKEHLVLEAQKFNIVDIKLKKSSGNNTLEGFQRYGCALEKKSPGHVLLRISGQAPPKYFF